MDCLGGLYTFIETQRLCPMTFPMFFKRASLQLQVIAT